jgi:hypothetical protein
MPKEEMSESVLHEWVHGLTFQMQALLLTAMRGPDENNKFNAAKAIVRYLRGAICKPGNNDFMWGDYNIFSKYAADFWADHDEYPHHFIMHIVHCAEVLGYKHPLEKVRKYWLEFYACALQAFHMNPETHEQMDKRLNDFGVGVHNISPYVKQESIL